MEGLLSVVISAQFVGALLLLIGIYASIWWCIDNLKSITTIVLSLMMPYFHPLYDIPLKIKYGRWAGRFFESIIISEICWANDYY